MLDDKTVIENRDSQSMLDSCERQLDQLDIKVTVRNETGDTKITSVVFVGLGGSTLAPVLFQSWASGSLAIPFEIVRNYQLPSYVGPSTLVVCSSMSGSTEEVLEAFGAAQDAGAHVAVIGGGGELVEQAQANDMAYVLLPQLQVHPRMQTFVQVRAVVTLLGHFDIIDADSLLHELSDAKDWLLKQATAWQADQTTDKNFAKQLALQAVGKTAVFYGGHLTASLAYKWKIDWNENAKNIAFWNQVPEANHNELTGWSSHPIEKPFAVFDLVSHHEHPRILRRFDVADRLLSGRRPKAIRIELPQESILRQLLWGHVLADYASVYLAVLNNVDPGPLPLVSTFKTELGQPAT